VPAIFQGTSLDIYVHWLILGLGIGMLAAALAVLFSCRSVAGVFHLLHAGTSWRDRCYRGYFRFHGYYWVALGFLLVFHLMVTAVHVGLPTAGEIVHGAHVGVFVTSLTNGVLMLAVLTSCRTVGGFITNLVAKSPRGSSLFRGFYRVHAVYWWLLVVSIGGHVVFGMVHAINT
jgi:hypothetical protein